MEKKVQISEEQASKIQQQQQQAQSQMDEMMNQVLTAGAKERFNRIKLVNEKKAQVVEQHLLKLAQSGTLKQQITENQVIQMMESYEQQQSSCSNVTIQRKGGLDDDW